MKYSVTSPSKVSISRSLRGEFGNTPFLLDDVGVMSTIVLAFLHLQDLQFMDPCLPKLHGSPSAIIPFQKIPWFRQQSVKWTFISSSILLFWNLTWRRIKKKTTWPRLTKDVSWSLSYSAMLVQKIWRALVESSVDMAQNTPLKFNMNLRITQLKRKIIFQTPFSGSMLNFRGVNHLGMLSMLANPRGSIFLHGRAWPAAVWDVFD